MKQTKTISEAQRKVRRTHNISFMLNDEEYRIIRRYLFKYRIANRSRWFRETILAHIMRTLEEDHPTLFNENEMRR